jgi:hypothetical protein
VAQMSGKLWLLRPPATVNALTTPFVIHYNSKQKQLASIPIANANI